MGIGTGKEQQKEKAYQLYGQRGPYMRTVGARGPRL
jgi:hypothetical protein